jgi:DNA-directed RNA polymerase subunit RPC12/RpoP
MTEVFEDHNRLVPVRTGLDQADAQLLRSLLDANGVQVFVSHENMGSLGYGVRADIMVRAIDKVRADAVLAKVATLPRSAIPVRLDEGGEEIACRHCGSERVHPYEGAVPTLIPGLRLAARRDERWYHCLQCDSYFRDRRSKFAGIPIALMWGATLAVLTLFVIWLIEFLRWL